MDPLVLFILSGFVAMSGALSAGAINKLPESERPAFAQTRNGLLAVVMAGNLSAATLIFAAAYGVRLLGWWIPLLCLIISFPLLHMLVVQRFLGPLKGLMIAAPACIAACVFLYIQW